MSDKWATDTAQKVQSMGLNAVQSVVRTAVSFLTLQFFLFLVKLLAMPLEVLLRVRTGVRYFSPLWLSLQLLILAFLWFQFLSWALNGHLPAFFPGDFTGGMNLKIAPLALTAFSFVLLWATGDHLVGSLNRLRKRELSFSLDEGEPRVLLPGLNWIRAQLWREIANDFVCCLLLGGMLALLGCWPVAAFVMACFWAMFTRRLLTLHQVWQSVMDAVDNIYMQEHHGAIGDLVADKIEKPLNQPFRKYLGEIKPRP